MPNSPNDESRRAIHIQFQNPLLILVTIFARIVKADAWRRSAIEAAHGAGALHSSLPAEFML